MPSTMSDNAIKFLMLAGCFGAVYAIVWLVFDLIQNEKDRRDG